MQPPTTITVTLDDQVNGQRIQVNLDATLPVAQVLDALIQLRRLPTGTREKPVIYDLIRVYNNQPLRTDLSLQMQGVQPGEELILAERETGLDERSKILLGIGAVGVAALLCVIGVVVFTLLGADPSTPAAEATDAFDVLTATAEAEETAALDTTGTPEPTVDEAEPTPTDTGEIGDEDNGCTDNLVFVADVTVPDKTEILPGESFTKTWRVQNTGTCDWSRDYLWIFVDEAQMGGPNGQLLGTDVPSGRQVDISVNLRAPNDPGEYQGFWQMQNPTGDRFGDVVFVDIIVPEPTPTPLPEADVTIEIDPEQTTGPFDLVSIVATAEREVPTLLIIVTGVDDEGEAFLLDSKACGDSATCEFDFGGSDNEYAGEATASAYACPPDTAPEDCLSENLGSASGTFVISSEIDAPSRVEIVEFEFDDATETVDVTLLWSTVSEATSYEYFYTTAEDTELQEIGETEDDNEVSFTLELITEDAFPITFYVRACNSFGCSGTTSANQTSAALPLTVGYHWIIERF